jgi:hypothetical protein
MTWNEQQLDYDRIEGQSADGSIYAELIMLGFEYIIIDDGDDNNDDDDYYTGRCQAKTQKGIQCKRNAEPGRIYCWQH